MPRSIRLALTLLAAGSLTLAACADDDGGDPGDDVAATTTTTTADDGAEFAEAIDALCAEGESAANEAGEDFDAAIDDLTTATETNDQAAYNAALDDAETAVEDIIDAVESFVADVEALEVPTDLQQPVDDYLEAMETQISLAEDLREAIVNDDGQAFNEVGQEITEAEEETRPVRTDAANEIGAPSCVPDGDEDDADTWGTGDTTETTAKG
ncbi:MAG TPA: hypothetical protein PKA98_00390 [Acidimicrobiales bacterium]|nr:hypothetical protein [Acidimicrobiales bacterium]